MGIQSANIGFGSGPGGGAVPANPLPFRMLVVANFLGRRLGVGEAGEARTSRVSQETLKEVLERLAPRLLLELPNHIGGADKTLVIDQTFKRFEDFRPEAIAAAQPGCA